MKLGAVPYLNALPLIYFLPERPRIEVPAALDRLLKLGELDLATAPITTLFENPGFQLVPGIGIGTRGAIQSVRLVFQKEGLSVTDLGSVALDVESKTSALLLKVLLARKYKKDLGKIRFVPPIPSVEVDAALLIGDKALNPPPPPFVKGGLGGFLDLGEEWTSWTGLPFTFAAWIGHAGSLPKGTAQNLIHARDKALSNLEAILPEKGPLSREATLSYFKNNTSYLLGAEEIEGLQRFHAYGRELGLIRHEFRLSFYPCAE